MEILHDVETQDLEHGDIVVHYGEQTAYVFFGTDGDVSDGGYVHLLWREQDDRGLIFSTTARTVDDWPTVIRP